MFHLLAIVAFMGATTSCHVQNKHHKKEIPVETVIRMTQYAARDVGIPERLAIAVMMTESDGKSNAISKDCAQGPMQLLEGTAKDWGVSDISDTRQNVTGGVRYLAWLRAQFHGDIVLTIASYNAGIGNVKKWKGIPPFAETRSYVPHVLQLMFDNIPAKIRLKDPKSQGYI